MSRFDAAAAWKIADLAPVVAEIAEGAAGRDARPAFPEGPLRWLAGSGVLAMPAPLPVAKAGRRASFADEWRALRAVARADGSVGRILDGHLNGVERLSVLAPEPLRSAELEAVGAGELVLGVWGADPIPGEGEPARLVETEGTPVIEGVKTFCSGAASLDRALVAVRGPEGEPPLLAYVAPREKIEVDRSWYRGAGMRASESHRVIFSRTPVLAILGGPGELVREPFFGRDAVRTAFVWAGIADSAVAATLELLGAKSDALGSAPDDIVSLAAGRIVTHQATIDRWLEHACRFADHDPGASMAHFAVYLREAVASACNSILVEAARAVGSRPFVTGSALDRSRRDLELFLLQHRIEPALARAGKAAVQNRGEV